jgi:hypothetical protein
VIVPLSFAKSVSFCSLSKQFIPLLVNEESILEMVSTNFGRLLDIAVNVLTEIFRAGHWPLNGTRRCMNMGREA